MSVKAHIVPRTEIVRQLAAVQADQQKFLERGRTYAAAGDFSNSELMHKSHAEMVGEVTFLEKFLADHPEPIIYVEAKLAEEYGWEQNDGIEIEP